MGRDVKKEGALWHLRIFRREAPYGEREQEEGAGGKRGVEE